MTAVKKVEGMSLQALAKSSALAERIMKAFKERERDTRAPKHAIDLRRFRVELEQGGNVDLTDFARVFSELERLGVGKVVLGKQGGIQEFSLKYPIKPLGAAAFGEVAEVIPLAPVKKPRKAAKRQPAPAIPKTKPTMHVVEQIGNLTIIYPMGNELVKIQLPASATQSELEKLAQVVRTARS